MGIISWIILGLIAGFIGSKIVDSQGQGLWLNIALGIVGALVGGFLFNLFGASGVSGLNLYSMIVAIVGAIVVLLIYNAVMGRRSRV
ncbi:MAG TPA: GlsB/YeaQ/YmgE family stress response membrane protein [Xanthobacteraceae bacterium]|nr:GlsB/YeaQ/YmgE family stress response membrane protein [Xanthobacteraceae bacterium]